MNMSSKCDYKCPKPFTITGTRTLNGRCKMHQTEFAYYLLYTPKNWSKSWPSWCLTTLLMNNNVYASLGGPQSLDMEALAVKWLGERPIVTPVNDSLRTHISTQRSITRPQPVNQWLVSHSTPSQIYSLQGKRKPKKSQNPEGVQMVFCVSCKLVPQWHSAPIEDADVDCRDSWHTELYNMEDKGNFGDSTWLRQ